MKKSVNLIISLLIGVGIFGVFLYKIGMDSVNLIIQNINFKYLLIYAVITTVAFFPTAWRWKIILKAYKKNVSFLKMMKYTLAGYAVSYVTPSAKVGGEPLRVYMLKKEQDIDMKIGTSSVILDKFIEFVGTAIFGFIGLIILFFLPQLPLYAKLILAGILIVSFYILFILYYRTVTGKGCFSSLFVKLRLNRIFKRKNFVRTLKAVEKRMEKFFVEHKREFFMASLTYVVYSVLAILEFKFLLLSFGINVSISIIILAIIVWGLANFVPVPAGLGVLEAGQAGLFSLLEGDGNIGFALSLLTRIRALLFVAIGFSFITHFSGKQLEEKYKKSAEE